MKRVIALGFFDGVHVGHGALLRLARERADALGCPAAALTFAPHPNDVISGEKTPLINTLSERRQMVTDRYGLDEMLVLPFDRAMMELDWEAFVEEVLLQRFEAAHLVCGFDYTFGHRGLGNARNLQEKCRTLGIGCDVVEKVELLGGEVSSSRIRSLLEEGKLEQANALLGHRHFLSGTVVHGRKLGRELGFPTANLPLEEDRVVPAKGVYAGLVTCEKGTYPAVTNIGSRPTVDGEQIIAESFLLDFSGDLYGQEITVELEKFLRPEEKFPDLQTLQKAVLQDMENTKKYFEEQ